MKSAKLNLTSGDSEIEPFTMAANRVLVMQGNLAKCDGHYLTEAYFIVEVTGPVETHEQQIRDAEALHLDGIGDKQATCFYRGPYCWTADDKTMSYYATVAFDA